MGRALRYLRRIICDAQLLGGACALMLLTYAMILSSVCSACCMCAVAIVAVVRAAEEQQAQQYGARGRDMVRDPPRPWRRGSLFACVDCFLRLSV